MINLFIDESVEQRLIDYAIIKINNQGFMCFFLNIKIIIGHKGTKFLSHTQARPRAHMIFPLFSSIIPQIPLRPTKKSPRRAIFPSFVHCTLSLCTLIGFVHSRRIVSGIIYLFFVFQADVIRRLYPLLYFVLYPFVLGTWSLGT